MKTKVLSSVFLTLGFLFLGQFSAQAQEVAASVENSNLQAPAIATVNISDAKIVSQNENVFKISFDLKNGASVQPQIIYSIVLLKQEGSRSVIVNQKVFSNEAVSLGAGETAHKEITYTAPAFLDGTHILVVEARNSEGFMFGMAPVDYITLKSQGSFVSIKDGSCKIYAANDASKEYALDQRIIINPNDSLKIKCDIENGFNASKNVVSVITTQYRSVFGKKVAEQKLASFSLSANEKTSKEFEVPANSQPQSYSGILKLTDEKGITVSNEAYFVYSVKGESAVIQNVILDKDAYKAGENANIQVIYSVNTDTDATTTSIGGGTVYITIKDGKGQACSEQFSQKQIGDKNNSYLVPVTKDCANPAAEITIKNKDEKVLAQNSFAMQAKDETPAQLQNQEQTPKSNSGKKVFAFISIALLIIVILFLFLILKRRRNI